MMCVHDGGNQLHKKKTGMFPQKEKFGKISECKMSPSSANVQPSNSNKRR